MAIYSVMVINNHGQARLLKFYRDVPHKEREGLVRECFNLVSKRPDSVCNFLECSPSTAQAFQGLSTQPQQPSQQSATLTSPSGSSTPTLAPPDVKLIYRHYATLYFVVAVDESESELGILDLIQVFVESLDKCFENVCELDLIFHVDKIHYILDEIVMAGMVLETSLKEILKAVNGANKYARDTEKDAQQKITVIGKKLQS